MTETDPMMEALFSLHQGLPRQGPGLASATRAALDRVAHALPPRPRVLDLGCGSGSATLILAEALPGAQVTGIDIHPAFLDQLSEAIGAQGLAGRVEAHAGDMADISVFDGTIDLIWSEGAAYLLTFAGALTTWRPALRAGGIIVLSECSWLVDQPPPKVAAFWNDAYPAMGAVAENIDRAHAAGFDVLFTDPLPAAGWTEAYYAPLRRRIAELRATLRVDAAMSAIIQETEREMALFDSYGDSYGYVFYGLRKRERSVD